MTNQENDFFLPYNVTENKKKIVIIKIHAQVFANLSCWKKRNNIQVRFYWLKFETGTHVAQES